MPLILRNYNSIQPYSFLQATRIDILNHHASNISKGHVPPRGLRDTNVKKDSMIHPASALEHSLYNRPLVIKFQTLTRDMGPQGPV